MIKFAMLLSCLLVSTWTFAMDDTNQNPGFAPPSPVHSTALETDIFNDFINNIFAVEPDWERANTFVKENDWKVLDMIELSIRGVKEQIVLRLSWMMDADTSFIEKYPDICSFILLFNYGDEEGRSQQVIKTAIERSKTTSPIQMLACLHYQFTFESCSEDQVSSLRQLALTHPYAQKNMGLIEVTHKMTWLQKAASVGLRKAQAQLATCYQQQNNLSEAIEIWHSLLSFKIPHPELMNGWFDDEPEMLTYEVQDGVRLKMGSILTKTTIVTSVSSTTQEDLVKKLFKQVEPALGFLLEESVKNSHSLGSSAMQDLGPTIPCYVEPFRQVTDYLSKTLLLLEAFNSSGFMVTCLQSSVPLIPRQDNASPFVKSYRVEYKGNFLDYLSFGKRNIDFADFLMDAVSRQSGYELFIKRVVMIYTDYDELLTNFRRKSLEIQKTWSVTQSDDDLGLITRYAGFIDHNQMALDHLDYLRFLAEHLIELLVTGAEFRNNLFRNDSRWAHF
ncbi:MAG: hypothetical protein K2Y18_01470 [Alphaproteobacteria bacterium]|nr:hypothetical protein [Alphaproteobacteria bacterium]